MVISRAYTSSVLVLLLGALFGGGLRSDDSGCSCRLAGVVGENAVVSVLAAAFGVKAARTVVMVRARVAFVAFAFQKVLAKFRNVCHGFASWRAGAFAAAGFPAFWISP